MGGHSRFGGSETLWFSHITNAIECVSAMSKLKLTFKSDMPTLRKNGNTLCKLLSTLKDEVVTKPKIFRQTRDLPSERRKFSEGSVIAEPKRSACRRLAPKAKNFRGSGYRLTKNRRIRRCVLQTEFLQSRSRTKIIALTVMNISEIAKGKHGGALHRARAKLLDVLWQLQCEKGTDWVATRD